MPKPPRTIRPSRKWSSCGAIRLIDAFFGIRSLAVRGPTVPCYIGTPGPEESLNPRVPGRVAGPSTPELRVSRRKT